MQRRLDSIGDRHRLKKPFKNVSCQGRIQKFFLVGDIKFHHFFKRIFFPAELILSNLSNKNGSRGSGGMFPEKIFENLRTVMAILVFFEELSRKVGHIFGP